MLLVLRVWGVLSIILLLVFRVRGVLSDLAGVLAGVAPAQRNLYSIYNICMIY